MKELFACFTIGTIIGFLGTVEEYKYKFIKIDEKITEEMKRNPTKYKDEFSFGYSIGLIKCSGIINEGK